MGRVRAFSSHVRWTADEQAILRMHYATASYSDLEAMLPIRSRSQIQNKAYGMGLRREKSRPMTSDEKREKSRVAMAEKRAADRDAARAYQREWRKKNRERVNKEYRDSVARRLFWGRALRLRGVTPWDLWKLWKSQRGCCALSGRRLDRSAEIDHIIPKVSGGTDEISNLQWVTVEANRAKRDLSMEAFCALVADCNQKLNCGEFIFDRIKAVEEMAAE